MSDRRPRGHVIERALSDWRGRGYYYDGDSPWTEGESNRPGKSMAQARNEDRNLCNLLTRTEARSCQPRPDIRRLARRLRRCTPATPCLSGACKVCGLAGQRVLEQACTRYRREAEEEWRLATFVETRHVIRCGDLAQAVLFESIVPAMRAALEDIPTVGGLEVCVNEDSRGGYDPFYAEHGHIWLPVSVAQEVSRRLRNRLPKTFEVTRPRHCRSFDTSRKGSAYAFKGDKWRWIELEPETKPDGNTCRRHRQKDILSAERVELALARDAAGLGSHVFLHGLDLVPCGRRIVLRRTL